MEYFFHVQVNINKPNKMSNSNKESKNCAYEKLENYYINVKFNFDIEEQPTITQFSDVIGEPIYLVGHCVLNTPNHFP